VPFHLPRSLFWRAAFCNGAVFSVAAVMLALSPATISSPLAWGEAVVLGLGTLGVIVANAVALRHTLRPLHQLTGHMAVFDPVSPGVAVPRGDAAPLEVAALTDAFDAMAARLQAERRESSQRALRAEEAERQRIARELHDEVGQSITVLLLELASARRTGSGEAIAAAQETARTLLHDVRHICHELRPESLDDLGLPSALTTLASRVSEAAGLPVHVDVDPDLPELSADAELVVLRVAQESLTNVVRHARATSVRVSLARASNDGVSLRIADDGDRAGAVVPGGGIRGMKERAVSVGGRLSVARPTGRGLEVRLDLLPELVAA
jgi:two-component system sensor histidine kinase UhpB